MTAPPDNWIRVTDVSLDRPAVVLDLDGVIADASHRQRYLRDGRRDWDGFFAACVDDPVIAAGAALASAIGADHTVVVLTGRPDSTRVETMEWLGRHRIRLDLLIMRPPGDRRSAVDFKHDELVALVAAGCDVRLAFDDSPVNVEMMRKLGVATLYIHSGYYEDGPSG